MKVAHYKETIRKVKERDSDKAIVNEYTRHSWYVQGDLGATEFHFDIYDNEKPFGDYWPVIEGYGRAICAGIERHKSVSVSEAMYGNCHIIGGPCEPDGSGLCADELIEKMGNKIDDKMIYDELEEWYQVRLIDEVVK